MITQFEIDRALMAGTAYFSTRSEINRIPVPQGWSERIEFRVRDDSSGFEARTFQKGAEVVISYAGTNPDDGILTTWPGQHSEYFTRHWLSLRATCASSQVLFANPGGRHS